MAATDAASVGPSPRPLTRAPQRAIGRSRRWGAAPRPPWQEPPHPVLRVAQPIALTLLGLVMVFPFVYVIAVSFSSYEDVVGGGLILFPAHPTLDAYRTVLEGGVVLQALQVSILLTAVGTALNMVMTTTLAYGLSRTNVLGSRFVLVVVLFTFLFQPGLIPRFLLVKELGLLDSLGSLVLPGLISAFNLVVIRNFFMNIPGELLDGARVDGAGDLRILWDIVLPLSKAVLAVIALFYGVALWNVFFDAVLYIRDTDKWPIQVILRQYVIEGQPLAQRPTNLSRPAAPPETIRMAVLVISTVPILLVYPFLQRYFTRGVLTGAVKG